MQDFLERMDEAEACINNVEDTVNTEKAKQVALLTNKLDDLENHSRRSNLRIVNMPEKVEGNDNVGILEKWLPEVLGPATFPSPPPIERAQVARPDATESLNHTESHHREVFKLPGCQSDASFQGYR